jgi:hypothetical protein
VGQLSTDELKEIIGSVVEQKLKEILEIRMKDSR